MGSYRIRRHLRQPVRPSPCALFPVHIPTCKPANKSNLRFSVSSSKVRIPNPLCFATLTRISAWVCQPTMSKIEPSASRPKGLSHDPESLSPRLLPCPGCGVGCGGLAICSAPLSSSSAPSGGRSAWAISDPDSGLCAKHAALLRKGSRPGRPAASLIGDVQEFRSAADTTIPRELYSSKSRNKSPPGRAAVMGLHRQPSPPHPSAIALEAIQPAISRTSSSYARAPTAN